MTFNGKIDQLAFISYGERDTQAIKRQFGLEDAEWIEDHVLAEGVVRDVPGRNSARLLFNYDTGIELEILQYLDGPNYASNIPGGQLCHVGMHANRGTNQPPAFPGLDNGRFRGGRKLPGNIIQQVETISHTNPFLVANGRHYRYTIYDTRSTMGVYLKVIERIEINHEGEVV